MKKKQTLTVIDNETGRKFELPVYKGTMGPKVVDATRLFREEKILLLDPGFFSTASCRSSRLRSLSCLTLHCGNSCNSRSRARPMKGSSVSLS